MSGPDFSHPDREVSLDLDDGLENAIFVEKRSKESLSLRTAGVVIDFERILEFVLGGSRHSLSLVVIACNRSRAYGTTEFEDFVHLLSEHLDERINPFGLDSFESRRVRDVMAKGPRGLISSSLGKIVRRQCERLVARGVFHMSSGAFLTTSDFQEHPDVVFLQPANHYIWLDGQPGPRTFVQDPKSTLIAPPCNPHLSTEPNKTQTILNVVEAEGPLTHEEIVERMQELLGPERAAKHKINALIWQLLPNSRAIGLRLNDDGTLDFRDRKK